MLFLIIKFSFSNSIWKGIGRCCAYQLWCPLCPVVFIAEGGPECLDTNQEAIRDCVNKTITKNLPKETLSVDNLPSLEFGEEQCR